MNIAIIGYGKMGREIERQALAAGHHIVCRVDPYSNDADSTHIKEMPLAATIDVAIEFSTASVVQEHAAFYADKGISAVVGTTGWQESSEAIRNTIAEADIAYLYGSNFSLGAHIFMKAAEHIAALVNNVPEYDVALSEIHHTQKQDRPSGTALSTAKKILPKLSRKKNIAIDIPKGTAPDSEMLPVVSQRVGKEPGYHELRFDSAFDTILLSHGARTREGFALGAVRAAEWIQKSGARGFLPVEKFIDETFKIS